MEFKACITAIAVVYAVPLLCGASEENSGRTTSESPLNESEYGYDY
ncbi:hypothetical protein MRX96_046898, partial [Rhipicephalus microplus]